MDTKRHLTQEEIDFIVDFIHPRPHLPQDIELSIVQKKKLGITNQLRHVEIYEGLIPLLKEEIEKQYVDSIISPGECVGIIGAQSMGEYSTQATLNTFHVAGIDTGSSTGVSRFQDLINASKTSKVDTLSLFFHNGMNKNGKLSDLRSIVSSKLTEVKLSHLTVDSAIFKNMNELGGHENEIMACISFYDRERFDYKKSHRCFRVTLSKQLLLKHRLHPSQIKKILEMHDSDCKCAFISFASKTGNGFTEREDINFYIFFLDSSTFDIVHEETIFQQLMDMKLCGVNGIVRYDFKKPDILSNTGEWYIETRGGTFSDINCLSDIFDLTKTKTTSVWDVYNTFGIEATKQFLIQELKTVMDGVDICHIKLLVERMTYSGIIEPITRYTMRSDESPLSRASFEESFETFMKAAKYKEVEPFNGVSAAVIGGKKAEIGTYMCDVYMDIDKLLEMNASVIGSVIEDTIYGKPIKDWTSSPYEEDEEEELVYVD